METIKNNDEVQETEIPFINLGNKGRKKNFRRQSQKQKESEEENGRIAII
jgi:hypothetical protein